MKNNLKHDLVVQLITGRNVKVKNFQTGKVTEEFKPSKMNRYPVLGELRTEDHDEDKLMISEGLRHRKIFINRKEFIHTDAERKELKKAKSEWKKQCVASGNIKFKMKTIVHVTC